MTNIMLDSFFLGRANILNLFGCIDNHYNIIDCRGKAWRADSEQHYDLYIDCLLPGYVHSCVHNFIIHKGYTYKNLMLMEAWIDGVGTNYLIVDNNYYDNSVGVEE